MERLCVKVLNFWKKGINCNYIVRQWLVLCGRMRIILLPLCLNFIYKMNMVTFKQYLDYIDTFPLIQTYSLNCFQRGKDKIIGKLWYNSKSLDVQC